VKRYKRKKIRKHRSLVRQTPGQKKEALPIDGDAAQSENSGIEADAYNRGYDEGFGKGHYAGGEGLVDQLMPNGLVLPGVPANDIIAAGLELYRNQMLPIMGTVEVVDLMVEAMHHHQPMSVVRLGDGELLTMAQETVHSLDYIRKHGSFLHYAGVHVPDLEVRDQLIHAVRGSSIVGIPLLRVPNFQHLAIQLFEQHGIDYRSMRLTHSTINYAIYLEHALNRLLSGRNVLLIGNQANGLADFLRTHGVNVVGAIAPVEGVHDVPRIMKEVQHYQFDLALVSAGIAAVILVYHIAAELGKVAIDFGHLADSMVKGEAPYS
jgi:hypothetical protein